MTPNTSKNSPYTWIPLNTRLTSAAAPHKNIRISYFFMLLLYCPPQNADAKIATAVPVAVMLPICVPENPICLRYCPIIGVSAPIAIYVK